MELLLFENEKILDAPVDQILHTMDQVEKLMHAAISNENWHDVNELNEWKKKILAPILREKIREETLTKSEILILSD